MLGSDTRGAWSNQRLQASIVEAPRNTAGVVHARLWTACLRYHPQARFRSSSEWATTRLVMPARVRVLLRRSGEHAVDNVPEFRPARPDLPSLPCEQVRTSPESVPRDSTKSEPPALQFPHERLGGFADAGVLDIGAYCLRRCWRRRWDAACGPRNYRTTAKQYRDSRADGDVYRHCQRHRASQLSME